MFRFENRMILFHIPFQNNIQEDRLHSESLFLYYENHATAAESLCTTNNMYISEIRRQVNCRNSAAGKDLEESPSSSLSQTHNPLWQTLLTDSHLYCLLKLAETFPRKLWLCCAV